MTARYGLCECGCGGYTEPAQYTSARFGWKKGEPKRFIRGHNRRGVSEVGFLEDVDTGCWVWQGATTNGYGVKGVYPYPGAGRSGRKMVRAHRWYYEELVGPIPAGLDLDHLCRNRACVNPGHLEPVTRAENLRRGREARQEHSVAA